MLLSLKVKVPPGLAAINQAQYITLKTLFGLAGAVTFYLKNFIYSVEKAAKINVTLLEK